MPISIDKSRAHPMVVREIVERAGRGKIKVKWMVGNQETGFAFLLTPSELKAYEEAKRKHFVVCGWKRKEKPDRLAEAYFRWCVVNGEPYVGVEKRKAYAGVTLDMISTDRRLAGWAVTAMGQALWKFSLPKATVYRGECYNESDRVRFEDAERLAAILYTIATA